MEGCVYSGAAAGTNAKWIYTASARGRGGCVLRRLRLAGVARRDELESRVRRLGSEVDLDVAHWRQDLVSVVVGVVLGALAVSRTQLEARQHRQQEPLELEQGVALARTQRPEPHHRVVHLLAELVELGVHETVVLELLRRSTPIHYHAIVITGVRHRRRTVTIWILLKQETVSGSGISWAKCKSAPCSRQITMPAPHHSVFYRPDALPAAQPTASKALKAKVAPTEMASNKQLQNATCVITKKHGQDIGVGLVWQVLPRMQVSIFRSS